MIRINLAPQVDQSVGRNNLARDLMIIGILCVLTYFGLDQYSSEFDKQAQGIDEKIAELQNSKTNMKKDIERAKEIRARADQIKQRTSRVRKLGEGRKLAIILLDSLQSKHPERMWFTKIAYSTNTKTLELDGYALDHTVIADYMKRLKEIGKIDSADGSELKNFIPPQLLNSDNKQNSLSTTAKSDAQVLDQVSLKQLISSEELQGVTLQKFEISIKLSNG